jgi:deoxyribodipyrimidine photo-lyase
MFEEVYQEPFFPTTFDEVLERVAAIDPVVYGKSRNYIDGAVSFLSPYISRGVISTKFVYQELLKRGIHPSAMLKFSQELAWRDYWQQVWIAKGEKINHDFKHAQNPVITRGISMVIPNAQTGIDAIDVAIKQFLKTGYLHNHLRMYIASISCNIAQNHWKCPAQWMFYYLLDADWASNALSWQWVAGSNSNKKYYANQENINTYCSSNQTGTFLDVSYDDFSGLSVPQVLQHTKILSLETELPHREPIHFEEKLPTLIYNFYNLDPLWRIDMQANRVLLLEPSIFKAYPVSQMTIDFVLALSKNIHNVQVYVGEFMELKKLHNLQSVYYKEHPLNGKYVGIEDPRDWMFSVKGYYPSFFAFWKKCKKELVC